MLKRMTSAAMTLAFLVAMTSSATAVTYSFTPIDVPGASLTAAYGISSSGHIVGAFIDAAGSHGFLRDPGGTFTTIDVPGAAVTVAADINAAGQIVGSFGPTGNEHGFLRESGGTFTTIDAPGATGTAASGINASGTIVGSYDGPPIFVGSPQTHHGFVRFLNGSVYEIGTFFPADPFTSVFTEFSDINSAGDIVGTSATLTTVFRGFLSGTSLVFFEGPGALLTFASGINDTGEIVGTFGDLTGGHGFVRQPDGTITVVDVPGATHTQGEGINNAGQIVGWFDDATGRHGFLASPPTLAPPPAVPEPASALLLLSGGTVLASVVWTRRRRRHP